MPATDQRRGQSRRISVIIPTYNRADYLPQAIDSVLQQNVDDIEIIVVDDGSTDNTREVVAAYGDRVIYLTTDHGGVGHARNVGVTRASGQYLAFLDSDDLFYPYMLELESRLLDAHPEVAMVYAEMSAFDDDGFFDRYHLKTYHRSAYRDPAVTYDRIFQRSARLGDLGILPAELQREDPSVADRRAYFGNVFDIYLTNLVVFQNNMLMRRSLVDVVGLRDPGVRYWEEYEYILRITRRHEVCFLDVPTYKLRYHPGQVSSTAGARGRYVWLRKQQCLLQIVRRHATADPAYYAAHRERLDRQFGHLHRAVAVPLLLVQGPRWRERDLARRARRHIRRAWRYGSRYPGLWLLSLAPGPARRLGIGLLEYARTIGQRLNKAGS
jgi:glycosyltransferase involved in cell wall biosynthesis